MRTARVNAANTVDDENFVDGATRQCGQRIRELSGGDQTKVKGERKSLRKCQAGTGISVAVTIAVAV